LANRYSEGVEIPYDTINEIAAQAGVQPGMSEDEVTKLLTPYGAEMVSWVYERVVAYSQEKEFTPIWIYLPLFVEKNTEEMRPTLVQEAGNAGFNTFDLSHIYDGKNMDVLIVAEWDRHPNGKGNEIIAEGLYQAFLNNEEIANAFGLTK
jgi:hypothetical protein